jgi:hypothetical protein
LRVDAERAVAEAVERDGFAVVNGALSPELTETVSSAISSSQGEAFALRNLFQRAPAARELLMAPVLREAVGAVLGTEAFCVRALFLDRPPRANWRVRFGQDSSISVKERFEVTGFGPWSMKGGVQHVMAPPGTLSSMLSVRVHLDAGGEGGRAARVVPGSHLYGRLPEDSIDQFTRYEVTCCSVEKGGILALRPLLLHASGEGANRGSMRVVQLDFAARNLPAPLEWREAHALF